MSDDTVIQSAPAEASVGGHIRASLFLFIGDNGDSEDEKCLITE